MHICRKAFNNGHELLVMVFQFIDNASIDRRTRKLIRSHAAKGKNIGKGRPRRKPRPANASQPPLDSDSNQEETDADHISNEQTLFLEQPRGEALSFYNMPFELSPRLKALFYKGR
jgi:hypothetical protein